jgi:SAM-dependent MidA family methyltransferase
MHPTSPVEYCAPTLQSLKADFANPSHHQLLATPMGSERTPLEREFIARIEREGPATFRDFMHAALYDPKHGYYNTDREKIGRSGDYYTASNVHLAFGAVLATAIVALLDELKHTEEPPILVEAGAGNGQLASDILTSIRAEHPAIFERLIYILVETSPVMRARQQQAVALFRDRVHWRTLDELSGDPSCAIVFSNELIDALPVHCVRSRDGSLEELFVSAAEGAMERVAPAAGDQVERRLACSWRAPSTPRLREYLERNGVALSDGQIAEINLDAIDWVGKVSGAMTEGFLMTIDYGDVAAHLYGPDRFGGTLRSFYRHALIDSVLERMGEQDITASVNFTALMEYGLDSGFETVGYQRQADFLMRNGLIERLATMEQSGRSVLENLKGRIAVKNLFVPGGISDNFRVLIQRKVNEGRGR